MKFYSLCLPYVCSVHSTFSHDGCSQLGKMRAVLSLDNTCWMSWWVEGGGQWVVNRKRGRWNSEICFLGNMSQGAVVLPYLQINVLVKKKGKKMFLHIGSAYLQSILQQRLCPPQGNLWSPYVQTPDAMDVKCSPGYEIKDSTTSPNHIHVHDAPPPMISSG